MHPFHRLPQMLPIEPEDIGGGSATDAAVIGKRTPLNFQGVFPNVTVQPTQLISARLPVPRQWVITLMQAVQQSPGTNPWLATFDGTVNFPVSQGAGRNFSAPVFPRAASNGDDGVLQVALRWGAGGAAWETAFDYPAAGAVFGLTADAVDIIVKLKSPPAASNYLSADNLPVVGAIMVEGQVQTSTPLRWTEAVALVAAGNGLFWSIKPYARLLHLSVPAAAANDVWDVMWLDSANATVWEEKTVADAGGIHTTLTIPAQAEAVLVSNGGAVGHPAFLEWQIGLT